MTPVAVFGGALYVAAMLLGAWLPRRGDVFVLATICSGLIVAGGFYSPPSGDLGMVIANRSLAIIAVWDIGLFLIQQKRTEEVIRSASDELEHRVRERTTELENENATLQEREEHFDQLGDTIGEVFWIRSLDRGRLDYISPNVRTVLGSEPKSSTRTTRTSSRSSMPTNANA